MPLPLPKSKGYWEKIADILPQAVPVIDSLQPYKTARRFKEHPLWQLNRLCNIDKHQVVAISHIGFQIFIQEGIAGFWRRDTNEAIEISIPLNSNGVITRSVATRDLLLFFRVRHPLALS